MSTKSPGHNPHRKGTPPGTPMPPPRPHHPVRRTDIGPIPPPRVAPDPQLGPTHIKQAPLGDVPSRKGEGTP
jgi:hypothetical protein